MDSRKAGVNASEISSEVDSFVRPFKERKTEVANNKAMTFKGNNAYLTFFVIIMICAGM